MMREVSLETFPSEQSHDKKSSDYVGNFVDKPKRFQIKKNI